MVQQVEFRLRSKRRGAHLITSELMQNMPAFPKQGILHLFIKHTSAALTINENADPDVRVDFESMLNHIVPENQNYLTHTMEGADDMPAHLKASIIGSSVSIPISNGRLNLGTWQGVYLCEFRDYGGERVIVATVMS